MAVLEPNDQTPPSTLVRARRRASDGLGVAKSGLVNVAQSARDGVREAMRVTGGVLAPFWPGALVSQISAWFAHLTPKGLYPRTLIIIIMPIVLLESVIAFIFMEQHWQSVTRRLSAATARDISMLVDVYKNYSRNDDYAQLIEMARDRLRLSMRVLEPGELPRTESKPFFALLDRALTKEVQRRIDVPFWVDTLGDSDHVEVRVQLPQATLSFVARRSQTFASNSHIFLLWMIGSAIVLLTVAILFLGNQIRPILRLSEAAENFGKGQPLPDDFELRGAREVRQATQAFIEMGERITTHVEQRTTMLAGVSHDLRTILTRFKLEAAMLPDAQRSDALMKDINEMQSMLEDYMAFARGDGGEVAAPTNMRELIEEVRTGALHFGKPIDLKLRKRRKDLVLTIRGQAFKRALANLMTNAVRYGERVVVTAGNDKDWFWIAVDDDGPGIPADRLEDVFKPFLRLDDSRNQDHGNTGLGLAIARDIVRAHGGDITLSRSKLGGLRAEIRLPL
ncbi:MAG: ATP-binding protein [Pseudomonadota bacterium]